MSLNSIIARRESTPIAARLGFPVKGKPHNIGASFSANHFSEDMFGGQMDPLIMVDHFVMRGPTFEPHLHAGISAVTFLFEDSVGNFLNRDTLGNNIALEPGDLYWLAAARGAVHDERPEEVGASTHALQIFVNLPARQKTAQPHSLHVRAADMPKLSGPGYSVRVALGDTPDRAGAHSGTQDVTLLDGVISKGASFPCRLPASNAAWIYAVAGELHVEIEGEDRSIAAGSSIVVAAADVDGDLNLRGGDDVHFVVIASPPLRETFVKHGPLVMSSSADVRQTLADYAAGKFGKIAG
jgi:redox-sensitive bicupin YhaK (pirin superfamily)